MSYPSRCRLPSGTCIFGWPTFSECRCISGGRRWSVSEKLTATLGESRPPERACLGKAGLLQALLAERHMYFRVADILRMSVVSFRETDRDSRRESPTRKSSPRQGGPTAGATCRLPSGTCIFGRPTCSECRWSVSEKLTATLGESRPPERARLGKADLPQALLAERHSCKVRLSRQGGFQETHAACRDSSTHGFARR